MPQTQSGASNRANPNAPGDFMYRSTDSRPMSPTTERPSLFTDGNPMAEDHSPKAMCGYISMTLIAMASMSVAIYLDQFLVAHSGAVAGLKVLYLETGGTIPLEGDWAMGGQVLMGSCVLSGILAFFAVTIMCCNIVDYHHRYVQFAAAMGYITALLMSLGTFAYEWYSRGERDHPKYNIQKDRYAIQRDWRFGTSFMAACAVVFLAIFAAIFSFLSTPEANRCAEDPCGTCKMCCCCSQKKNEVVPFEMPASPITGPRRKMSRTS